MIHEDNQSAICTVQNSQYHSKTKHIDINYRFVREKLSDRTTELKYCPTYDMLANMMTKRLTHDKFTQLSNLTSMKEMTVTSEKYWIIIIRSFTLDIHHVIIIKYDST